jgi:hypothetical protein
MAAKTKVYSVRLQSLRSISDKAYEATAFDGSKAILPKSQVFSPDWGVSKSDAHWIAAWVLEKKELQYSSKKVGWYNHSTGRIEPNFEVEIEHHVPSLIDPKSPAADADLTR